MRISISQMLCSALFAGLSVFCSISVAEEPPPLPLHGIEGYGGVLTTYTAYIPNQPTGEDLFGMPSVGFAFVSLGHEKFLYAPTLTEAIGSRLELGYGFNALDLGDLT